MKMNKNLRSVMLFVVLVGIMSSAFAIDSTITFKGGTAITQTDININETYHFMGGFSFEVWLKDYLSLGISPYFATFQEESSVYKYKTKAIGGDLQMRLRPVSKVAYRSDTGFFSHIGPYVNVGVGLVNHDVDYEKLTPMRDPVILQYTNGGLGVTVPNVGLGVSFITKWGVGIDLGAQFEWSPFTYHLDELDGYQHKSLNDSYLMPYVGLAYNFSKPKDRDGDGIIDRKDKDPDHAEDFDGFEDWDGAPDYDNDGDGILDVNDKAPGTDITVRDGINTKETYNGYMDEDGVPDVKPEPPKPIEPPVVIPTPEVTPTPEEIKPEANVNDYNIESVLFDTNYATIKTEYYPTMNSVYTVLKDNASWNLDINGHADHTGSAALNQRLSLRRAQSAKDYLVRKGITASRISVKGFGYDQPVASNDTLDGRTLNRRVDFKFTK